MFKLCSHISHSHYLFFYFFERSKKNGTIQKWSKVKKHYNTLEHLSTVSPEVAQCLLESGGDDLIEAVGELCRNLLKGNVPLSETQKAPFLRHSQCIRLIAKKKTSPRTPVPIIQYPRHQSSNTPDTNRPKPW